MVHLFVETLRHCSLVIFLYTGDPCTAQSDCGSGLACNDVSNKCDVVTMQALDDRGVGGGCGQAYASCSSDSDCCEGLGCSSRSECHQQQSVANQLSQEYTKGGFSAGGDTDYVIKLSLNQIYIIGGIVIMLLLMNISCLCYINCCSKSNKPIKYHRVKQIVSSDDDIHKI